MSGTSRETNVLISSGMRKGLMSYMVYDTESRLLSHYEATVGTKDGGPCFLTEYKYIGNTSVIQATKETVAVWSDAYNFDNLP